MKKILFTAVLLLIVFQFSHSNETFNFQKEINFSFVKETNNIKTDLQNSFGRPRRFTGMAIAGTVIFGTSWLFIIPGAALMGYGWENRWVYNHYWSYGREVYEKYIDLTTFYVGAGVLSLGLVTMFTGLPLMIVGWILRSRTNVSIFIDNDRNGANMGFALKL